LVVEDAAISRNLSGELVRYDWTSFEEFGAYIGVRLVIRDDGRWTWYGGGD
jgi:hypothetical protein